MSGPDRLAAADLARTLAPGVEPQVIRYLEVVDTDAGSVSVDADGVTVPVPFSRCYGCGGVVPTVGDLVACHVNSSEIVVIGSRSL